MSWPSIKEIACPASLTAWPYLSMSLSSLRDVILWDGRSRPSHPRFFSSVTIAFPNTYYSYYTWLANQHFLFIFYIFFLLSFFHSTLVINFHFSVLYFSAINHSILKKSHLGAIFLVSLFIDFKQFSNLIATFLFNYFFFFFLNKDFSKLNLRENSFKSWEAQKFSYIFYYLYFSSISIYFIL